jgi:hypothetical protein
MSRRRAALPAPGLLSAAALLALSLAPAARAALPPDPCAVLLQALGPRLEVATATCFESADLTTNNPATTPANNSIAGLPPFAFTPQTDRGVISPDPPDRTPITKAVPGVQLDARLADDATGEARFLLRVPADWNGSLVVAGASGTRSEFNGDFAWSDLVVQKGYAYASQNKRILNLFLVAVSPTPPPSDPLACRLNPASTVWVHFYDNDAGKEFTQWGPAIVDAAGIARDGVLALEGRPPRYTYAVGTSNGGYQVRRALELAPHVFDGGVDWEGTFVDPAQPNILTDLPPAIRNFPAYVASGFDPNSAAAQAIEAAGYPPDLFDGVHSLWGSYSASFWEVTQCQWQKRLDPTYDTYGAGPGNYDYAARAAADPTVLADVAAFENTGDLRRPLVTIAGTMDALLPIEHHARAYARKVAAVRAADAAKGREDDRHAPYRLYEVQNGNHIENFKNTFPQLELIQPHAQRAFELLVRFVEEHREPLPPDQCIPRGGAISATPAQKGQCRDLFVP